MARYADVIVNISREELDKSFQYRIPDELQEAVTLGTKVEFPFSTRVKVSGYVVGLSDEPKIDEASTRRGSKTLSALQNAPSPRLTA